MDEYREEVKIAVEENFDDLYGISSEGLDNVATFLESLADSIYDGDILEEVAKALRDTVDGY